MAEKQYWKKIYMGCSCDRTDPYENACDFCLAERGCREYVEESKMEKGITWLDLYTLLKDTWGDHSNDYTRDRLVDAVKEMAKIPPAAGDWHYKATNEQRNVINKLINTFVNVIEPAGPYYDDHAKTQCRLCGSWNGLHRNCPACNLENTTYSFEECVEGLNKLIMEEAGVKSVGK